MQNYAIERLFKVDILTLFFQNLFSPPDMLLKGRSAVDKVRYFQFLSDNYLQVINNIRTIVLLSLTSL